MPGSPSLPHPYFSVCHWQASYPHTEGLLPHSRQSLASSPTPKRAIVPVTFWGRLNRREKTLGQESCTIGGQGSEGRPAYLSYLTLPTAIWLLAPAPTP